MDNLKAEKVFVEKGELIAALYDADAITMDGVRIINQFPAADVATVRPELRKAVRMLHEQYERAINRPAVRNPLAWALCRTWLQMDGDEHG